MRPATGALSGASSGNRRRLRNVRYRTEAISIFEDRDRLASQEIIVKITLFAATMLLSATCMNIWANGDEAGYNLRAAQTDMAVFRELDRAGQSLLTREAVKGDMRLGTRFDDIDTNRDEIVTLQEMRAYIEKTYGVIPAPR